MRYQRTHALTNGICFIHRLSGFTFFDSRRHSYVPLYFKSQTLLDQSKSEGYTIHCIKNMRKPSQPISLFLTSKRCFVSVQTQKAQELINYKLHGETPALYISLFTRSFTEDLFPLQWSVKGASFLHFRHTFLSDFERCTCIRSAFSPRIWSFCLQ